MTVFNQQIAIIGAGQMARAMVAGLCHQGFPATQLCVTARTSEKLAAWSAEFGVRVTTDNVAAVEAADICVLCVKPWQLPEVAEALKPVLARRRVLIISVMTGVSLATFADYWGDRVPVVRAMPNTPSQISAGVTGYSVSAAVMPEEQQIAQTLLTSLGAVYLFANEADLDAVTALTGSGPAYVLLFMEALQAAGVSAGLDPKRCSEMVAAMVAGTAQMAQASSLSLAKLRQAITSKGGTTEQALMALEAGGFVSLVQDAFDRAWARAQAIAAELKRAAH